MRRVVFGFVVAAVIVLVAAPAWAHVTISPASAPQGSDAVLSFVVPNEMDNATTVKLQVQFPSDHPIAEALVQPVAGWTATVAMKHVSTAIQTDSGPVTDAVDTVTWSANAGTKGIAVGDFQQFAVSVGLPDVAGDLGFPAIQTYSNGQQVKWIETTPPGGQEPDHPTPKLTLTAGEATGTTTPTTTTPVTGSALPKNIATKSDVDSAKNTAIVGVIVGAIGVVLAAIALVLGARRRSTST
jgi:uncharacterized protein